MKKIILSIVLAIVVSISSAQILFSFSGAIGNHTSKDFRAFGNSYEALLGNNVLKSRMRLGMATGLSWGIDLIAPESDYWDMFGGMYLGFRHARMESNAFAKLNNGTRNFTMRVNEFYCPVGYGMAEGNGFFTAYFGIGLSNHDLISSFEYPNGTISRGTELILNGTYSGTSFIGVPGVQMGFSIGKSKGAGIVIFSEINYRFSMGGSFLEEKMYTNSALVSFSGDADFEILPKDYQSYMNNSTSYDFENKENKVQADVRGFYFSLGIKLKLF